MISLILLFILVGLLVAKLIKSYIKLNRLKRIASNIPGPRPLPFFGNSLSLGWNSHDLLQNVMKYTKQYGPTTALWFGSKLNVYISDKEDMKTILSSNVHITKAKHYDWMADLFGNGLLTADGEFVRKNRKIIAPTLNHPTLLMGFISVFNSNYKMMVDILENELGKDGFDIGRYFSNCAMDNILETSMSYKPHSQTSKSEVADSYLLIFKAIALRNFKFWLHAKILFKLSSIGRIHDKALKYLNDFVREEIIKKKISNKENQLQEDEDEFGEKRNKSFIDLMIKIKMNPNSFMTDEQLRDEVIGIIAGGHGTLTDTLSFCIYELARHQDIQNKALEEIKLYFREDQRDPTFEDLQNFPYLERIIKETMRFYPFAYFGRYLKEDVILPSGYTVPAGSSILFDWINLHRDPEEYPDPERFNPDNFLPEHCERRHPYAFVPFSAGPRSCFGKKYAMATMKCALIHLLRTYKFLPAETLPGLKLACELLIYSTTGFNVRIEKR